MPGEVALDRPLLTLLFLLRKSGILFSQHEQYKRKDMKKKQIIGLAVQAGGALGAYEVGVIKALYKHYPNFQSNLRVVAGASSGALNAAVLVGARRDPVQTLEQLWLEHLAIMNIPLVPESLQPLLISLTGVPGMAYIRPSFLMNPLMAPSIADPTPMRQTLIDLADEDRIEHSPIHLIVTATDVETGQLTRFENHIPNEPFTFEMVAASGSIAPVFPMTSVTEQITGKEGRYWDGGFVASLPLSPVINFLERCEGGDPDVERVAIAVEVNPRRSRVPRNMLEIVNRFSQLITASKLKLDQKMFDKMDSHIELFHLLDQHLTDEDRKKILRDPKLSKAYEDLKSHRKIHCIVIEMTRPESLTGPSNFSKSAIEDRIECGYEDAYKKLVDEGIITDVREYAIPASA